MIAALLLESLALVLQHTEGSAPRECSLAVLGPCLGLLVTLGPETCRVVDGRR